MALSNSKLAFSTVELVLAISLISIFFVSSTFAFTNILKAQTLAEGINEANFLANEGVDVVKSIRANIGFENINSGTYGLIENQNFEWMFSANPDTYDGYTRSISVQDIDDETKKIIATVLWTDKFGIQNSISHSFFLKDIYRVIQIATSWLNSIIFSQLNLQGNQQSVKLIKDSNYVYLLTSGGNQLSIIDVSNPTNPNLVSSLSLNGIIYDMVKYNNYVILSSSNNSSELYFIDVSNVGNPVLNQSTNVPNNNDAIDLELSNNNLYVLKQGGNSSEIYFYNLNDSLTQVQQTEEITDRCATLKTQNSTLVVGCNSNTNEVRVYNLSSNGSLAFQTTKDLSGNANPTAFFFLESVLYVGKSNGEITSLDISNTLSISEIQTANYSGVITDFSIVDNYLFASTTNATNNLLIFSNYQNGQIVFESSKNFSSGIYDLEYDGNEYVYIAPVNPELLVITKN